MILFLRTVGSLASASCNVPIAILAASTAVDAMAAVCAAVGSETLASRASALKMRDIQHQL